MSTGTYEHDDGSSSGALRTIADHLAARADDDATALLTSECAWTWRDFVRESAIRAQMLSSLRRDESPWHIGVLMDNDPEYLFVIGGAALAGATIVGINPTRRGAQLADDVARTDCSLVIVGQSYLGLAQDLPSRVERIAASSQGYRELLRTAAESTIDDFTSYRGVNHDLLLLFTSGSTGTPKAVVCSSARLAAIGELNVRGLTRNDVSYNAMPLFHGNALMSTWAPTLCQGGTFAMRQRFSASKFLPDVIEFGATFFNYVGRSLSYVLAQPESPAEATTKLRLGFGTEASATDQSEFMRRYGCTIIESYGSSEGVCVIMRDVDTPDGALGVPRPELGLEICHEDGTLCATALFDDDGIMLNPDDAIGEIVARGGAARFEGYYNNPEAMSEKVRDGDYWSGDLAYRDTDGNFWFAGRTSDWVRVDSENFATAPLERILTRFDGVRAAAAYAVPDPRTGDTLMVALETNTHTFEPEGFARFLTQQADLGTKWTPSLVRITDALPLTATRKIDKPALRRVAWHTDDPLFEFVDGTYRLVRPEYAAARAARFAAHDRLHLLPRDPRPAA